jgi:hypothetical protein
MVDRLREGLKLGGFSEELGSEGSPREPRNLPVHGPNATVLCSLSRRSRDRLGLAKYATRCNKQ